MNRYEQAYEKALQLLKEDTPADEILSYLATAAEVATPGTVTSILLLDVHGLLRNGASPKLPKGYLKAIDGLKPHPHIGTCAAAAATGSVVITEDFYEDSKWSELRHLPMSLGFNSGWSMPIITMAGRILGTFGTYYTSKQKPTDDEMQGVALLASAAAQVLDVDSKQSDFQNE